MIKFIGPQLFCSCIRFVLDIDTRVTRFSKLTRTRIIQPLWLFNVGYMDMSLIDRFTRTQMVK